MPRHPKVSNEVILATARQIFLAQGMRASTASIAEAAGISEAAIFRRFATKQDLFMASMGVTETPDWEATLIHERPSDNVHADLIDLGYKIVMFYQRVLPRVFMTITQGKVSLSPDFLPPTIRDTQLVADFLARAMQKNLIRPCQTEVVAQILIGTLANYVVSQSIMNQMPPQSRDLGLPLLSPYLFVENVVKTLWCQLAPDRVPESELEPAAEPTAEPELEPAAEPTAEPTAEP
jgi:AcrR family transcriptional regulator